ncbi:MAG TPA: peptidylprolyl isomerase [Allosphingosinicella sp.]|jgi:peptidyl-prolyl cis-trans isomerase SurA
MKLGTLPRAAALLAVPLLSAMAAAQASPQPSTQGGLTIPDQVEFLGRDTSNVRKATAIVNGEVITETDIDHRLALVVASNNVRIPAEEMQRIRAQILRNLIDEALQIQAAQQRDIEVEQREIDTAYGRVAERSGRTRATFAAYLRSIGSSERSLKRQIHAEIAWARLQQRISQSSNVSESEVQAILDRLNASRGTREFRVSEIFISATPENASEAEQNAARIFQQIRAGASFPAYARQFSQASTAPVGGDLGWVRAEQLPDVLAQAVAEMPIGSVSPPIAVPGGYSIIALADSRQILMPDARDAVLSLIQMSITFPRGTTEPQARANLERFVQTTQTMGGCGGAQAAAQQLGAGIVANDQIRVRDLPPQLQEMLLNLAVGQATRPFGAVDSEVSVLVLCGRDDPEQANAPTFESIQQQLEEERMNRRAQRFLRDLRRDAVIEYR